MDMLSTKEFDIKHNGVVAHYDGTYINDIGSLFWYNEAGERHREDGPAIIFAGGTSCWYLNDTEYTYNEWQTKQETFFEWSAKRKART
jgi:hypothetical protein